MDLVEALEPAPYPWSKQRMRSGPAIFVACAAALTMSGSLRAEEPSGARGSANASVAAEGSTSPSASTDAPMKRFAPERNMVELGIWLGILIPSSRHEFYDPRTGPHRAFDPVAFDIGLRFAYFPLRFLGGELEVGFMPTRAEDRGSLLYTVRGHLIGQLPWWRLTPFLVVGGGGMGVSSPSGAVGDDIDASFHWGPGLKFFANRWIALRLDLRHLVGARVGLHEGASNHFEVLLGLSVTLGRKKDDGGKAKSHGDPDGDGFYGHDDRCPNDAGTYPDGCPAPDHDRDGVADASDKCPQEAGPAPDGCPAPDRDADGVADEADACPDQAGAKPDGCPPDSDGDGVQDPDDRCVDLAGDPPDGCPPDGDQDGVYDGEDQCPREKEIQNGFEDEDGCPDEVPKKLRGAAGVLPGITFELNSAQITASSRPTLDEAARVMKANPDYVLHIEGHTDNTGPREHNLALSQRRADAVRNYLVSAGVKRERVTTQGVGPDRPIADNSTPEGRAENRRIDFKVRKDRGWKRRSNR